ncbi:MAG: glycosyl hydrolase [Acidobacteria bacterium]|nr:MAG: glycosyl hydrolase [Acidobacteriota bacterium]
MTHPSRFRSALPLITLLALLLATAVPAAAQKKKERKKNAAEQAAETPPPMPEVLLGSLKWRSIGPYRGGRSAAVTGVVGQPNVYYFGGTGGGVWKTTDAGNSWQPISDGFFGGSIGAIEVNQLDPNVIYVGGGEVTVRGNVSHGSGLWKSTDAGKTWSHLGFDDAHHIPRIRSHPRDSDLVYVAALGHLYGPNEERGVYRSKDGGKTWEKILYANADAGAVDLILDPSNPRILYASTWRVRRTPYSLESGGEGSGLFKSTDGGDSWTELTRNEGLPQGTVGIIGITVSPSDPQNLYAIVEAEDGGVFRSRDGGETWRKVNDDRSLRQRAWYYTRIYADPADADSLYVLNVQFHFSKDGGKTFETIRVPHGDNHDLWIDPHDPLRMIEANDGGANVSFDRGRTWSPQTNQPTAQFYRVTTDNHVPYRLYGAQQDNSTVRILSRGSGGGIGPRDWEPTAGGESGHIAPKPDDPEIVYGGSYGGFLTRVDHRTGEVRAVNVWPDNPMGWGAAELKYRFQWNFPIFFSPHDPNVLYTAANVLFKSTDEGQSWQEISPDLTRNDKSTQGPSGGPITKDNTSVEYYGTIFAALESPHEAGVLWTGSDDGLIHLSRDGGTTWSNVTPPELPEWSMINSLEAHPFEPGGLYVAATRYKLDDFSPYLYKTTDYGATWTRIDEGIDRRHFTRVVRADPGRRGLLYAGTELGVYVSFDDGERWQPLQLNLPIVPITDLAIKNDDLIAATQGRSFWVLDDLTPLHQLSPELAEAGVHLLAPRPAVRLAAGGRFGRGGGNRGENPPSGVVFHYYLKEDHSPPKTKPAPGATGGSGESAPEGEGAEEPAAASPADEQSATDAAEGKPGGRAAKGITLEILDAEGAVVRTFSSLPKKGGRPGGGGFGPFGPGGPGGELLPAKAGMNRFEWNLRYDDAERFPGMILWSGFGLIGPMVLPGSYRARLTVGDEVREVDVSVQPDPRIERPLADLEAQLAMQLEVRDKLSEAHRAIGAIRDLRSQLEALQKRLAGDESYAPLLAEAKALSKKITAVEEALYQTKNRSRQDPLNFPIRLTDKLASLAGTIGIGQYRPTDQAVAVKEELFAAIDAELATWREARDVDLPALNRKAQELATPVVVVKEEKDEGDD